MINCSECCFYDRISIDSKSYFFCQHFNIPEMEMGLAIENKKALCHSLTGGIFFFLREVHQIMYLTVSGVSVFMKSKQTKARRRVLTEDLVLLYPEGIPHALTPAPGPPEQVLVTWHPGTPSRPTLLLSLHDICLLFPLGVRSMSFHRDVWSPYSEGHLFCFYVAHEGPEEVRVGESWMARWWVCTGILSSLCR